MLLQLPILFEHIKLHFLILKLFDFVFIDGSIGKGDCEEILKRTKDSFKIVFHDYMPNEDKDPGKNKGWYNMKIFKETTIENYDIVEQLGGSHCGMLTLKKDK